MCILLRSVIAIIVLSDLYNLNSLTSIFDGLVASQFYTRLDVV